MPSLAAMSFQHSVTKGRSLLGKPGMFVMRLPVSSAELSQHPPVVDDKDLETLETVCGHDVRQSPTQLKVSMM